MNNRYNLNFFRLLFQSKAIYSIIGILVLFAFFSCLVAIKVTNNMYFYIETLTDLPIIHFVIMPIYLGALTLIFQMGWTSPYAILKYKKRRHYLNSLMAKVLFTSIIFVLCTYALFFIIGFFVFNSQNEWYEVERLNRVVVGYIVVGDLTPLTYMLLSASLLIFCCLVIGLFYLIVYLKTKNTLKALMSAFLLLLLFSLSWIIKINKLTIISEFVFISMRFYLKTFLLKEYYQLGYVYVYWLVFILVFLLIAIRLIRKEDLLSK